MFFIIVFFLFYPNTSKLLMRGKAVKKYFILQYAYNGIYD